MTAEPVPQAGRPAKRSFPLGRLDGTTQLSWTACCSHLWKRGPRMRIWLRWLCDSWRKWISCAPKWPVCGVRIWNCGSRPAIGRADTPMPCGVSPRWNRKTNSSAARSASCKPNGLDAAPRSNPAATAPMNSTTQPTPSPSVRAGDNPVSPLPDAAITATCPRVSSSLTCPKQNRSARCAASR